VKSARKINDREVASRAAAPDSSGGKSYDAPQQKCTAGGVAEAHLHDDWGPALYDTGRIAAPP